MLKDQVSWMKVKFADAKYIQNYAKKYDIDLNVKGTLDNNNREIQEKLSYIIINLVGICEYKTAFKNIVLLKNNIMKV